MKISKAKQAEVRENIVWCAVKLISLKGYKKTSMSKIAKEAKIGEATIYNYYPTKEHILYEYYYMLQVRTKEVLLKVDGFSNFTLKEQLQLLINTELELMLEHRTFVLEIYKEIFYKSFTHPAFKKGNSELLDMVEELVEMATEAGEIEPLSFKGAVLPLFSDYLLGVVYYWVHDKSEKFNNTTVMVDKSLDLIYSVLQSSIINKSEELVRFVVKTHILNSIKPTKVFEKRSFGEKNA